MIGESISFAGGGFVTFLLSPPQPAAATAAASPRAIAIRVRPGFRIMAFLLLGYEYSRKARRRAPGVVQTRQAAVRDAFRPRRDSTEPRNSSGTTTNAPKRPESWRGRC